MKLSWRSCDTLWVTECDSDTKIETDELLRIIFNQFRFLFQNFQNTVSRQIFPFCLFVFWKLEILAFPIYHQSESFGIRCLSCGIKCLLNLKLGRKCKQFICKSHLNHFRSSDRTFIEHLSGFIELDEFYLELCPTITGRSLRFHPF